MRKLVLPILLLAGCGDGADGPNPSSNQVEARIDTSTLTGLYEGGGGVRADQLCIIGGDAADGADRAAFGILVWGTNLASCAGSGTARRAGDRLILRMAGDQPCEVEAVIRDGQVRLPTEVPESCSYYCGDTARLSGAGFRKTADTIADAMKAKDLVGEPLCEGLQSPDE